MCPLVRLSTPRELREFKRMELMIFWGSGTQMPVPSEVSVLQMLRNHLGKAKRKETVMAMDMGIIRNSMTLNFGSGRAHRQFKMRPISLKESRGPKTLSYALKMTLINRSKKLWRKTNMNTSTKFLSCYFRNAIWLLVTKHIKTMTLQGSWTQFLTEKERIFRDTGQWIWSNTRCRITWSWEKQEKTNCLMK